MNRIRVMLSLLCGTALLAGCESGGRQVTAKAQAAERWNNVRAEVKARLAAEQLSIGATEKASLEIAEARQLDPVNTGHKLIEARVLLAEGRVEQADLLLADVQRDGDTDPEVAYLRGVVAQQQLRWPVALDFFLAALDGNPHDIAYLTAAAGVLLQVDQADSARALLAMHAETHDWTPAYQATLAEVCEQQQDWEAAAGAWERVLGSAASTETFERLALALERAGRYREAIVTLEDALAEAPREEEIRVLLALARCEAELEMFADAGRRLRRILARHPGHGGALQGLAELLVQQGAYAEALPLALSVLENDPRNVSMLELAAAVAFRLSERDLAADLAGRVMAADPDSPVGRFLLAQ